MNSPSAAAVLLVAAAIVCCGVTFVHGQACLRPDRSAGSCLSVYECPSAMRLFRSGGISAADAAQLRSLQCQGNRGTYPWICCELPVGTDVDGRADLQFPSEGSDSSSATPPPAPLTPPTATRRPTGDIGSAAMMRGGVLPQPGVCGVDAFGQRIYGGQAAGLNEFPWMALLQYRNTNNGERKFNCGGALINSRYVLTAAHCLVNAKSELVLSAVRLGEYDLNSKIDCVDGDCADQPLDVGVDEFVAHPQFDMTSRNQANDIALVRLAYDVPYTEFIQPVCLPSALGLTRSAPNALLFASGWGRTLRQRQSPIKMKVQLPVVEQATCTAKYAGIRASIVDSQLCAGSLFAVDTCDGDSGGPLMTVKNNYWLVEGVVSFGRGCGLEGWPAIYTRVTSFEDWIQQTIRD